MKSAKFFIAAIAMQTVLADDTTLIDRCGVSSSAHNESMVITKDILLDDRGPCVEIFH